MAQILLIRALFRQFTALVTINQKIIASCNTATPDMGEKMQNLQQVKHPANDANPDIVQTDMKKNVWGMASAIDIYDCDPEVVQNFSQHYFGGHHSRINITLRH